MVQWEKQARYTMLGFPLSSFIVFILILRKAADMPKSFLSDDPFAAALDDHSRDRRPASAALLLLIPALGLVLMTVGMRVRPGVRATTPAAEAAASLSHNERRAAHLASVEAARRNVLHWQRENCCGGATPHSRAKLRAWERSYRWRLSLFARKYPER